MKLGVVLPRYGQDIVGGTEHWLRVLCEHLVSLAAWQVDVFTTCARSAVTWADELPPGSSTLAGVTVHRFESRSGRSADYAPMDALIRRTPTGISDRVANRFVELVGPVCPDLLDAVGDSAIDLVAVSPYVFWPSVQAVRRFGPRVIMHAAAHDEAELHLRIMEPVFRSVGGFAYNSRAERALVEASFPVRHLPSQVVGATVVEQPGDSQEARKAIGLAPDEPFVLCLGRVERFKGSHVLAELWRLYRSRRPWAPRLVFLGSVNEELVGDEGVLVAGQCSEVVKWGALRACELLIAPSSWESFSLVVVEGWLGGVPALVNARCAATVEHCRRGLGGLWFDSYASFEMAVDRLLGDSELRHRLAANGRSYATQTFDARAIVDRYLRLAERVAERLPQKREGNRLVTAGGVAVAGRQGRRSCGPTDV